MESDKVTFKIYIKGDNNENIFFKDYVIGLNQKIIDIKNIILNEINEKNKETASNLSEQFNSLEMINITDRIYKDFGKLYFEKGVMPDTIENYKLEQFTNGNRIFSFMVSGKNVKKIVQNKNETSILKKIIREEREYVKNTKKEFCLYDDDFPPLT